MVCALGNWFAARADVLLFHCVLAPSVICVCFFQFINDELIQRNKTLLEMGEAVLEESVSRAISNFGAKHYDDACLVVWQFTPQRVPQTQTHAQQQQQQQQLGNGINGHALNGQQQQQQPQQSQGAAAQQQQQQQQQQHAQAMQDTDMA
jgi:hypothetical protein